MGRAHEQRVVEQFAQHVPSSAHTNKRQHDMRRERSN
jgi:hypothetical protein